MLLRYLEEGFDGRRKLGWNFGLRGRFGFIVWWVFFGLGFVMGSSFIRCVRVVFVCGCEFRFCCFGLRGMGFIIILF